MVRGPELAKALNDTRWALMELYDITACDLAVHTRIRIELAINEARRVYLNLPREERDE